MNIQNRHCKIILVLILGIFTSFSSFAGKSAADRKIVVINTFDVGGNADGFIKMINEARATARKSNPGGQGKTRIISGNIDGEYSHLITVSTTYRNLKAYSKAYEQYDNNPKLEAHRVKLDKAGYKVIHRSINTVIAEY